jgi:hypothetical protein
VRRFRYYRLDTRSNLAIIFLEPGAYRERYHPLTTPQYLSPEPGDIDIIIARTHAAIYDYRLEPGDIDIIIA